MVSLQSRYDEVSSVAADWFAVDGDTGLITTRSYLDCEAESNPRVIVVAEDGGDPRQTATATLSVSVADVNDNVPLFESAFYEARLPEDKRVGECFLKVGNMLSIYFLYFILQGWAKEWSLGCVNSRPAATGSREAGFTQPRDRSFAHRYGCTLHKSWAHFYSLNRTQFRIYTLRSRAFSIVPL